jgi:branched-chain amino acid transport system ATP-binding protein
MSELQALGLHKYFGGLAALVGASLTVGAGERRAIIGPNGAGKTTLFNLIAGEFAPSRGQIRLDGKDITRLPVHARAEIGLARTFQRNNLFLGLPVFENVRLAVQRCRKAAANPFRPADRYHAVVEAAEGILAQLGLAEARGMLAGNLAYGQQRALEVALALATEPRVLLLDEPTAGMSPAETGEMARLIEALPRSLTLLIVEHDMDVVFSLADRITVLHYGQVIAEGAPDEVRRNSMVQEIYLGAGA